LIGQVAWIYFFAHIPILHNPQRLFRQALRIVPWPEEAGPSATACACVLPMVIALSSALMRVVERSARLVYRASATGLAPCLPCCRAVRTYHSTSRWLDRITTLALSLECEIPADSP